MITHCFSFLVGGSQFFTFVLQSAQFEFQFVKSAIHVSQLILSIAQVICENVIENVNIELLSA